MSEIRSHLRYKRYNRKSRDPQCVTKEIKKNASVLNPLEKRFNFPLVTFGGDLRAPRTDQIKKHLEGCNYALSRVKITFSCQKLEPKAGHKLIKLFLNQFGNRNTLVKLCYSKKQFSCSRSNDQFPGVLHYRV